MKTKAKTSILTAGAISAITLSSVYYLHAQKQDTKPSAKTTQPTVTTQPAYLSLKLELENAIKTGNQYLKKAQDKKGYWKDNTIPAYTAMAITAAMRDPNLDIKNTPEHIKSAYKWLLSTQKKNGGFYVKGLATYNTATGIMALAASGDPAHIEAIRNGRNFLISQQADFGDNKAMKNLSGGVGYGASAPHSNMSTTTLSVEAIKITEALVKDSAGENHQDLDWDSLIEFVSRCQNLHETNKQPGISNDGSYVYYPGESKAGTQKNVDGTETLRGYGSMTYAGLLSMIYADLDEEDPRVTSAVDWLNKNFTTKENPGMGQQGLYYYFNIMAKALSAANIQTITTKDGKKVDWRSELSKKILTSQREDGSWTNKNSRWWENQPELVTCYAVLTLETIHGSLPNK